MAGKTFPAFPVHEQPAIFRIWQEANASDEGNYSHVDIQTWHWNTSLVYAQRHNTCDTHTHTYAYIYTHTYAYADIVNADPFQLDSNALGRAREVMRSMKSDTRVFVILMYELDLRLLLTLALEEDMQEGMYSLMTQETLKPGPLFTKKTPSYQYRDSHYKPETVVRPS